MAFADAINAFCDMLPCSSQEIAAACGISPSALSRYRSGQRTPVNGSKAVGRIAKGLAALLREHGSEHLITERDIMFALTYSEVCENAHFARFSARLDALMRAIGLSNRDVAEAAHVDSSYVSRIRNGQRSPYRRDEFARACAKLASKRCIEQGPSEVLADFEGMGVEDVLKVLSAEDQQAELASMLLRWLTGTESVGAWPTESLEALTIIDGFDYAAEREVLLGNPYWADIRDPQRLESIRETQSGETASHFYYGLEESREAELAFIREALVAEKPGSLMLLHSRLATWDIAQDEEFLERHRAGLLLFLEHGGYIGVIHNLQRPFREFLVGLKYWLPLYLTGRVHAYYREDVHEEPVQSLVYVADTCVLTAEGIAGDSGTSRYHLMENEMEAEHSRRKINAASVSARRVFELFRMDDPDELQTYERKREELLTRTAGVIVAPGRFENLRIISYPGECSVLALAGTPAVRMVILHEGMNASIASLNDYLCVSE